MGDFKPVMSQKERERLGLPLRGPLPKACTYRRQIIEGEQLLANALPKAVKRLLELMGSEDDKVSLRASETVIERMLGKSAPAAIPIAEDHSVELTTQSVTDQLTQAAKLLPANVLESIKAQWLKGLRDAGHLPQEGEGSVTDQDQE